jgi:photosystem II stability/assembly factor-like uncharacterized protein
MMDRRQFVLGVSALGLASFAQAQSQAGYSWKTVPYGAGGFIDGFVFHPKEPGLLYARTDIGGAYRFEPKTQSWTPLLDFLGKSDGDLMGVLAMAVDPRDPNRVYAACGIYTGEWARKAALLASNDRGATWQINDLDFRLGGNEAGRGTGERLCVDPSNGDVIWLGTTKAGLHRSANRGRNFTKLDFPGNHVSLVLVDPQDSRVVWVGCHDLPGLYVTRDGGATFERASGVPSQVPQRAAFGPDGTLYISFAKGPAAFATNPGNAAEGSVWKMKVSGKGRGQGGEKWTEISPLPAGKFGYSGLDVDAKKPGRLIVSTIERWSEGDDIFLSEDDGKTWRGLGANSHHNNAPYPWLVNYMSGHGHMSHSMGHWIADAKLDPHNPERAIYGTGYGLWISRQLSAPRVEWDFTVAGFEETATLDVKSPSGGATLLAAMGDVSGAAWDDISKTPQAGLFAPTNETNRSVDFAQDRPAVLARTSDHAATGGYVSVDGGVSWRPFGPSARKPKSDTGTLAVSAKGTAIVWSPRREAAMVSHDLGKTWTAVQGWPEVDGERHLIPVADRAMDGVFHLFDEARGELLVSVDGGRSFKTSVTGLAALRTDQHACLVSVPGRVRDLWLALPDALVRFPGLDAPIQQVRSVAEAWLVAVGKGPKDGTQSVYLWGKAKNGEALVEGIHRSDDNGETWQRINTDAQRWGYLLSMSADPLEHGTVYVAAHGRGVFVGKPK